MTDNGWSPQGPVRELSDDEVWVRLAQQNLGHLGISIGDQPEIYPVNYLCDGQTVLFRTAPGEKLRELMINRRVAFEVDAAIGVGTWSVVITGRASVVSTEPELTQQQRDSLPAWIPTQQMLWVRLVPEHVRGRFFEHRLPVGRI
ncbi:MAG: pyridoxamine 5'-phosphate oxidase family protein [Pseudolysinimonas sp.]